MDIVTFFTPKGGAGRTTSVMATASAMIEAGHMVAVLDVTEQASPNCIQGQSFIKQWSDIMHATEGVSEQFQTGYAFDHAGVERELKRFRRDGNDFVLVDTPRNPNPVVIDLLSKSELIIMPVTGAHEAAWASAWLSKNRQYLVRHFGLITGVRSAEERQLTRETFTGVPVFNIDLRRSAAFGQQVEHGHLHAKPKFDAMRWGKFTADEFEGALDWTCACRCADALCREIVNLIDNGGAENYAVESPLAVGDTFAHLNAVLAQPRYQQI